jgi:release factor glutamine methyltransferase
VLGLWRPSDLQGVEDVPEDDYTDLVRRRAERIPLQHLVGSAPFRYLELAVGPGVFVPRPETEVVVEWAVRHAPPQPLVVDLCTGSGAIALSLAYELRGATVHAVEADPVALKWARRNDPEQQVVFHLGSVAGCLPELDGTVDVVVSNPPYLPVGTELDVETAEHDPELALWGGADGLDVVRQVEAAARRLLKAGGLLVVEHDVTHGEAAPELLRAAGGWTDVADHDDLTGRPRFVTARWQA